MSRETLQQKVLILLSGDNAGAGATTLADKLKQEYGYLLHEGGQVRRRIAHAWKKWLDYSWASYAAETGRPEAPKVAEWSREPILQLHVAEIWQQFQAQYKNAFETSEPKEQVKRVGEVVPPNRVERDEDELREFTKTQNLLAKRLDRRNNEVAETFWDAIPELFAGALIQELASSEVPGLIIEAKLGTILPELLVNAGIPFDQLEIILIELEVDPVESARRILTDELAHNLHPTAPAEGTPEFAVWFETKLAEYQVRGRDRISGDQDRYAQTFPDADSTLFSPDQRKNRPLKPNQHRIRIDANAPADQVFAAARQGIRNVLLGKAA